MIEFMHAESEEWFYKVEDGKRSASFTNRGRIGMKMWEEFQVWIDDGNTPLEFEPIVVEKTPDELKSDIRWKYSSLMAEVAKPYSPEERETWFKQQEGSELYSKDGTVTTFIQNMADARGISVSELIAKIEENINQYDIAIATLLGTQQKELDELG